MGGITLLHCVMSPWLRVGGTTASGIAWDSQRCHPIPPVVGTHCVLGSGGRGNLGGVGLGGKYYGKSRTLLLVCTLLALI